MPPYPLRKRKNAASYSNEHDTYNTMEPLDKQTKCDNKPTEITNASINEESNERSIFILNDDCWRILLSYVSLWDIVNSERVCRKWYDKMQDYLQGVRVCLRSSLYPHRYDNFKPDDPKVICRTLSVRQQYYGTVIKRFGSSIVAADCINEEGLRLLRHFCPGLQELKVYQPKSHDFKKKIFNFNIGQQLRRISFDEVALVRSAGRERPFTDVHIARLLHCKTLEELEILNNESMRGDCLTVLQTNLKSLRLENCKNLHFNLLMSVWHRLTELTQLKFNHNRSCDETFAVVSALINKMPKLEYLALERYGYIMGFRKLVGSICILSHLRHLSLFGNDNVTDESLEAVGRCCKELRAVSVGACKEVTAEGVLALCHGAGGTLAALDVSCNDHITDNDVLHCIKYCPMLEMLDVQFCSRLTEILPARAAVYRACLRVVPPVLRIHMPHWLRTDVTYDGLILDFSASNNKCQGYE